ncbi:hypothetical protein [Dyella sp. RRB7]|uniref:hypothetical protein n=1 Tax=Dyella sp. RRB7 TaxID=2919502 RepID=UPI001FA9449B|nr:hypothetical protein [Dyella sp. RRB7]
MTTHHHHDEPLPGEDELKALYRSLPRNEPTPALDDAVRRAAAAPLRTRRTARWPVTAASAAVLVLAAGLGWQMRDRVPGMRQTPAPAAVSASTPAPAATAAPAIQAVDENAGKPASATIPAQRFHEAIRSATRPRVVSSAPSIPLAAPPSAPEMTAAPERVMAPVPPAPTVAVAAPAPAETPTGAGNRMATMKAMAASPPLPIAPAPVPAMDPTAARSTDTPAQELDKIRQLLTQQRRDEALRRLAAFQRAHPDVTLPDDLRAQLPDHD